MQGSPQTAQASSFPGGVQLPSARLQGTGTLGRLRRLLARSIVSDRWRRLKGGRPPGAGTRGPVPRGLAGLGAPPLPPGAGR